MPLVIVISGLAGSGKTTLGEKLNKLQNVNVVELDDIDDESGPAPSCGPASSCGSAPFKL